MEKSNSKIDKYIKNYPKDIQKILKKIKNLIKELAPDSVETISYGIPTFDVNKKHLVHFAAFKNHISFFPTPKPIKVFKKELTPYKTSKGTIQFPLDKPIPYDLVKKIVRYRLTES